MYHNMHVSVQPRHLLSDPLGKMRRVCYKYYTTSFVYDEYVKCPQEPHQIW